MGERAPLSGAMANENEAGALPCPTSWRMEDEFDERSHMDCIKKQPGIRGKGNMTVDCKGFLPGDVQPEVVPLSLARIEREINSIAEEQHQIFGVIRELHAELVAKHTNGTNGDDRGDRRRSSRLRTRTDLASRISAISAGLEDIGYEDDEETTALAEMAMKASSAQQSSLDARWPVSVLLRPELAALQADADLYEDLSFSRTETTVCVSGALSEEAKKHSSFCMMRPDARVRIWLDTIAIFVLTWDIFYTPLQLAWNFPKDGFFNIVLVIVASFWTLDLILNFRTGYYIETGDVETRPFKVARHYLRRQFFVDFLVIVLDWFEILAGVTAPGAKFGRVLKLLRFVRILRVLQMTRFQRLEDSLMLYRSAGALLEALKISTLIIWLMHVASCMWFAIGQSDTSDTGLHWLDLTLADSALTTTTYAQAKFAYQYCSALQWALTAVVNGETSISPVNCIELIFCCFCIVAGLLGQALVVSILSSSAVEQKARMRSLKTTTLSLQHVLYKHKVTPQLVLIALSEVKASFEQSTDMVSRISDLKGLQKITAKLRSKIFREVFEPQFACHSLFLLWSQVDKRISTRLASESWDVLYSTNGQDIFLAGDFTTKAYLLSRGRARYWQDPDSSRELNPVSEEVSLDVWLCEPGIWVQWFHVGTMETATDGCELHCLDVPGLLKLLESTSTKFKFILRSYALQYHKCLTHSVPPQAPWPSDLHIQGSTYLQISSKMQFAARKRASLFSLQYAASVGLVDEVQAEVVEKELEEGKSSLALNKSKHSPVSLCRVVSAARILLWSRDQRVFIEIGKWYNEKFTMDVKFPTAKQKGTEDIWTTVARVVDRLAITVGDVDLLQTDCVDEQQVSKKTKLSTHYCFTDAYYCIKGGDICDVAYSTNFGRVFSVHQPPKRGSITNSRRGIFNGFNAVEHAQKDEMKAKLAIRLVSKDDLLPVVNGNETAICMWLNEQEVEYLKSRKGVELLEGHVDEIEDIIAETLGEKRDRRVKPVVPKRSPSLLSR